MGNLRKLVVLIAIALCGMGSTCGENMLRHQLDVCEAQVLELEAELDVVDEELEACELHLAVSENEADYWERRRANCVDERTLCFIQFELHLDLLDECYAELP